jgi:DNA adenine methylase
MRMPHSGFRNPQRPLLKWAGGKRQLLPQLRRFYPEQFGAYIEPFVGSGAVFFDLLAAGRLDGHDVTLIDVNPDLIGCYELVRDQPGAVADALDALAAGHQRDGRAFYYRVRDEQFNPERARRRDAGGRLAYTPALAAMFVYLNRTGYNGLFRVNSRGAFNVPAGRYARPDIANRARLMAVAEALGRPRVRLQCSSFTSALAIAKPGDFLYIDPPYEPISRTASFTSYTDRRFDARDQTDLHEAVLTFARQGCHVLLSNSTAQHIARLYDRNIEARRAGLRALRVPARRAVNSNATRRGPVFEYLITNQR